MIDARGVALVLALAAIGCSADVIVLAAPPSMAAHAIFTLGPGDAPVELRYVDGPLPDPLRLDVGVRRRVLAFDHSLAAELVVGADGLVPLHPREASADLAWELPAPSAAFDLAEIPAAFDPLPLADAVLWSSSFRVERPGCAPLPTIRRVDGVVEDGGACQLLRWDDRVLVSIRHDQQQPAAMYLLDVGGDTARRLDEFVDPDSSIPLEPKAFIEGDHAQVLWKSAADPSIHEKITIDRGGRVIARRTLTQPAVPMSLTEVAGSGGTVVMRGREHVAGQTYRSKLYTLEGDAIVERASGPEDAGSTCAGAYESLILEMSGPRSGWVGMLAGPIWRFDLDRADVLGERPYGAASLCRDRRVGMADGAEAIVTESTGAEVVTRARLFWRASPTDELLELDAPTPLTGQVIGRLGDLILTGGHAGSIAVYDVAPIRPRVPPRFCGAISLGVNGYELLVIDGHRALIGGLEAPHLVWIEL